MSPVLGKALPILLAAAAGACGSPNPRTAGVPLAYAGRTVAHWRVEVGGRTVGWLTELSFPAATMERYYRVEDEKFQDVGFVTGNGIAYRFMPHSADPVHAATGTMEENLRALFGTDGPVGLVPVEPDR